MTVLDERIENLTPVLRWRMFEPCMHGDWRCAECAYETVDGDGKTARCGCECHVLPQHVLPYLEEEE